MVVRMESYVRLRTKFIEVARSHENRDFLKRLISCYSSVINSRRREDDIDTLEDLIAILEKRGALAYDNIEPFQYISREFIRNPGVEEELTDYKARLGSVTVPLYNVYACSDASPRASHLRGTRLIERNLGQHASTSYAQQPQFVDRAEFYPSRTPQYYPTYQPSLHQVYQTEPQPNLPTGNTPDPSLQEKVFLRVAERIGRYWRDLARHLDIREYDIDNIENNLHLDLKEKAYKVLKIFARQSDPQYWAMDLMRALDRSRRRDLKEIVEKLIS